MALDKIWDKQLGRKTLSTSRTEIPICAGIGRERTDQTAKYVQELVGNQG